jgi:hypothetical protein
VIALAGREGARLVRHPIFIGGFLLSLGVFGLLTWNSAPVLHRDDTQTPGALLPLAAATLIVGNLAAIRAARDGSDELFGGLPTVAAARMAGHLVSLVWAVLGSLSALAVMFLYALVDGPVGAPRFGEIAVGPLTVFIFGAIGVLIAGWKKHVAIAPIAVVALITIQILMVQPIVGIQPEPTRLPWFAFWVPLSLTGSAPPELVIRPSGAHALYLLGIAGTLVAFSLMRFGLRRPLVAMLVAALVVAGAGAVAQTRSPSAQELAHLAALVERPDDFQVCRGISGNTYCAYPAYEPWIDRWAAAIGGVIDALPAEERPEGLLIRQSFGTYFEGWVDVPRKTLRRSHRAFRRTSGPGLIEVGYEWGRGTMEGLYEFGLVMPVATKAVGLSFTKDDVRLTREDVELLERTLLPQVGKKRRERYAERTLVVGRRWDSCTVLGQARGVVANWLAAQATPATRDAALTVAEKAPYGLMFDDEQRAYYYTGPFTPMYGISTGGANQYLVSWSDAEFHYAVRLLDRSDEAVGDAIRSQWATFTSPETPTTELVTALGLERLPTIAEQIRDAPAGYKHFEGDRPKEPEQYVTGSIPCH